MIELHAPLGMEKETLIFVGLLLTMGSVESHKYFCYFLENLTKITTTIVNSETTTPTYS